MWLINNCRGCQSIYGIKEGKNRERQYKGEKEESVEQYGHISNKYNQL